MYTNDANGNLVNLQGVTTPGVNGAPPAFLPAKIDAGSTGSDFSTNMPAFPVVGANFGNAGLYANYVLLTTIPANPARANAEIPNLTGQLLVVLRDDGTALAGNAPTNASLFVIAPGLGAGAPGVPYVNRTFKGRYQIFGPPGTGPVSAYVD